MNSQLPSFTTRMAAIVFSGVTILSADAQPGETAGQDEQRAGNTSVHLLEARYCRNIKELPGIITACDLFEGADAQPELPAYVVVVLQHFHGQDHDGSIVSGIDLPQIDDKGSVRSPSIKLMGEPRLLETIRPKLPKDFQPSAVDKVLYKIITLDEKLVPDEVQVKITAGFEDESHEFAFTVKQGVAKAAQATDPIDALVAQLNASHGMWINGLFPIIELPADAKAEQVLAEAIKMTGFDRGHIKTHRILEVRKVPLDPGLGEPYFAALMESDLGKKIFLFKTIENQRWWTRFYDVPADTQVEQKDGAHP